MPDILVLCKPEFRLPEDLEAELTAKQAAVQMLADALPKAAVDACNKEDGTDLDEFGEVILNFGELHARAKNANDLFVLVRTPEIDGTFKERRARRVRLRRKIHLALHRSLRDQPGFQWPKFDLEVVPYEGSGCVVINGTAGAHWD